MEIRFLHFLFGYVRIRIIGNSYDRFLNLCAFHRIGLWDLVPCGETYEAYVTLGDFRRLRGIARKSHASVRICQRHGLPFWLHRYRKRKACVMGVAAAALFMFWLSSHIWNISVEGNLSQTDDVIFEYLEANGVVHGMNRSQVDCKALAADIRNYFSDFAWVAAELKGTRLVIHVKEGILGDDGDGEEAQIPSDLVAARDGTVLELMVRSGTPVAAVGDEVKKGDLLVSGILPVYGDDGSLISRQYVASDADILLQTETPYEDVLKLNTVKKQYTEREKKLWEIRILGTSFALPQSFEAYPLCDILTELKQVKLSENFYLPVYLREFTIKEYENVEITYTKQEASEILTANFQYFVKNLEEKGVQIFQNDVKIRWSAKTATASGILITGEYAVQRTSVDSTEEELLDHEYG